jgi:hypothetical protein
MRELNEEEKTLTEKGLDRVNKEKAEYVRALEVTKYHKEFLEQKRKYDDYMRPFNRDKEDKDLDTTIKGYESEIRLADEKIKSMNSQLNEGVEVKDIPLGVN